MCAHCLPHRRRRTGVKLGSVPLDPARVVSRLEELRALTGGYAVPQWACDTFRALYHGLGELESAMHVHVHLENNVLFPRALASVEGA